MSYRAPCTLAFACALAAAAVAQESTTPFQAARVVADASMHMELVDDLNGDGYPDALGFWWEGDNLNGVDISALFNDGQGGFDQVQLGDYHDYNFNWPDPHFFMGLSNVLPDGNRNLVFAMQSRMQNWRMAPDGSIVTESSISTPPYEVTGFLLEDIGGDGNSDIVTTDDGYTTTSPSLRLYRGYDLGHYGVHAALYFSEPLSELRFMHGTGDAQAPDMVLKVGGKLKMIRWTGDTWSGNLSVSHNFDLGLSDQAMVTVGDIDGDLDEDVVVFEPLAYTVLRRTGPGQFNVESAVAGGPATNLVDVDADGDLDGLCCGSGSGNAGGVLPNDGASTFRVSMNDGSGGFAPAFDIPGMGANHLAGAVDVDLDGDINLLGGRCVVYAKGAITGPIVPLTGADGARVEDAFDFDGDGDLDLQVGLHTVMRSMGDGTFEVAAPWVDAPAGVTFDGPGFPGDFDGDGDVDLLTATTGRSGFDGMHLLRNNGGGGYEDAGRVTAGVALFDLAGNGADAPEESLAADADGDGDVDLFIHSLAGQRATELYVNDGLGQFTLALALPDEIVRHVVDLDGDNTPDLVTSTVSVGFRLGLGNGAFSARTDLIRSEHDAFTDLYAVADLDGDDDLDIAVTREISTSLYQSTSHLYRNDGSASFTMEWLDASGWIHTADYVRRIALAADVSGDGLQDLLLYPSWRNGPATTILVQDGAGGFLPPVHQVFFGESHQGQAFLAAVASDIDSDGDIDLLTERLFANTRFHGPDAGGRRQYGAGSPGGAGMVPTLGARGPFRSGADAELRLRGGAGGAPSFVTIGFAESSVPDTPFQGMTDYNAPWFRRLPFALGGMPGEVGTGSFTLHYTVNAGLAGLTLFHQMYVLDPSAPNGWSSSGGLALEYR